MVSFTLSTCAGTSVMENAAIGHQKVAKNWRQVSEHHLMMRTCKSPSRARMMHMATNTGQSCNAVAHAERA